MCKYAIVVIGYNNSNSILRLLNSLNAAEYGNDIVPLIISIDKSENDNVEKVAQEFEWGYGDKIIRTFSERQGLKKHIMSCGNYLREYEAIFVLEDDVLVTPFFYEYGKKCIDFYKDHDKIEGISLYGYRWNQNANLPFEPVKREYDTYFMSYAPSWGQIWLRDKWSDFMSWYNENEDFFEKDYNPCVPKVLYSWGKNSWLKYHIAYCELKQKYFVYPYYSYSTAFIEKSTHYKAPITRFQVELALGNVDNLYLATFDEHAISYNAFFENEKISNVFECSNVLIDLYGVREPMHQTEYMLSTQVLPYVVEKEFALQLRPIDMNALIPICGEGIYLYNLTKKRKITVKSKRMQIVRKWNYFMRDRFLLFDEIIPVCWQKFSNLIRYMFK